MEFYLQFHMNLNTEEEYFLIILRLMYWFGSESLE